MKQAAAWLGSIALALALTDAPKAQDVKQRADAPEHRVGDEWRYRVQDIGNRRQPSEIHERVQSISGPAVWLLGAEAGSPSYWKLLDAKTARPLARHGYDANAADQRGAKTGDQSASDAEVQFPLELGKTYKIAERWINSSGGHGTSDLKASVVAIEKVNHPSGEYDAFRIEISGWWNAGGGSGKLQRTVWYAPAAKSTVRREHKDYNSSQLWNHYVSELLEFKPAPP